MPLVPVVNASHKDSVVLPSGLTAPSPVTTTRREFKSAIDLFGQGVMKVVCGRCSVGCDFVLAGNASNWQRSWIYACFDFPQDHCIVKREWTVVEVRSGADGHGDRAYFNNDHGTAGSPN